MFAFLIVALLGVFGEGLLSKKKLEAKNL